MGRIRKEAAREAALLEVDHKIQEERQRIAEHLLRKLQDAGFVCSLGDNSLEVPSRFTIQLTRDGMTIRQCAITWNEGKQGGVLFDQE